MSLTFKQIENEVRRLAAENPDFVYQKCGASCFYVPKERGGVQYCACLFGQVFINLGEPLSEDYEGTSIAAILADREIVNHRSSGYYWALRVQNNQDYGMTWADAVANADEFYPLS